MESAVYESVTELLLLVGSAVGSLLLTAGGMLAEQAALRSLSTGHLALGAWEAWMGVLALVVGAYLLGYREFWPRLRRLRHPR